MVEYADRGFELEIKLVGAGEAVSRLREAKAVRRGAQGPGGWERLVTTYYDTPARELEKQGLTLRLREEGAARLQAVKRTGAGLARREAEQALAPGAAFPAPLDDDALAALIDPFRDDLVPVARTATDRWSVLVAKGGARIEAAIDLGRAEALDGEGGEKSAPLAEAELELVEGDAKALFRLARRCVEETAAGGEGAALRVSFVSKADRARMLGRPMRLLAPDPRLRLDTEGTTEDAFAAALAACVRRLAECAPAVTEWRAPEGVHQMRVALRRFRAVERLWREAHASATLRRLAKRARGFARALGPARDWDVFLGQTLPPLVAAGYEPDGLAALKARAEALRAESRDQAARAVGSVSFNLFLLDLMEAAERRPWRKTAGKAMAAPVARFAEDALDARLAAARAVAASIETDDPAARHPLRIELKKLRYAAQTFRGLYPRETRKPYMAAMSRLQDVFGGLNDAVVAQSLANAAAMGQGGAAARAAGFVAGYRAREAEAKAAAVAERWAAFDALAPFWRDAP